MQRQAMRRSLILAAILLLVPTARALAQPLPAPATDRPGSLDDLPEQVDAFAPPTADRMPADGAPGISEWTRAGKAGQTLVIAGYNFDPQAPRFIVFAQTGAGDAVRREVRAISGDRFKALLRLPAGMPEGMIMIWPVNDAGPGRPVAVNRAELWWAYPRIAEPGGTLSVFGRNLNHRRSGEAGVYLEHEDGTGHWLDTADANPYRVDARLPDELPDGKYRVWLHNGHGGRHGFAALHHERGGKVAPSHITVRKGHWAWTGPTIDVTDHGARPDGKTDCSPAIAKALEAARKHERPTIHFPAGTYRITRTIRGLKGKADHGLRLTGAGKGRTILQADPEFEPNRMIVLDGPHLEVRGMSFDLNTLPFKDKDDRKRNMRKTLLESPGHLTGLRMIDVEVDGERSIAAMFTGRSQALIRGCDFIGRETRTATMKDVMIDRCNFRGRADAPVLMYWYGGWNIAVTNCTGADFNREEPESWDTAMGRFFTVSRYGQRHENVYIAGNETTDLTVRPQHFNQNSGEQIMWEFLESFGQAKVTGATATTVTLDEKLGGKTWYADVVIVAGKGLGQTRQLSDRAGQTLTVARPWDVVPDQTSVISVANSVNRIVVYKNKLDAKERAYQSEKHIASSGVQPFGSSHTLIVDGNTFHEIRGGVVTFSLGGKGDGASHTFSHRYENNTFEANRWGIHHRGGHKQPAEAGLSCFNVVARNNTLSNILEVGALISAGTPGTRTTLDSYVLEDNTMTSMPTAIELNVKSDNAATAVRRLLIRGNKISAGERGSTDRPAIVLPDKAQPIVEDNAVTGYAD